MTILCAEELRRDQQWDRTRRDPELLAEVLAERGSRLTVRAALVAVALNLDTFDHPERADEC